MSGARKLTDDGDGWIVEERIVASEDTASENKSRRSYYFRNQLAVRRELKTVGAKRLAGLHLIEKDIRTIGAWVVALKSMTLELMPTKNRMVARVTFMPKDERMLVVRGLFVAILATYGKMFTTAAGRGTSLDKSDCGVNTEHLKVHDWLMHQRHTFAAHSGLQSQEGCQIAIAVDYKLRTAPKLFVELHQPAAIEPSALDEIGALLKVLHANVLAKIKKATKFAYSESRQQFTDSELKSMVRGARGWWLRDGKDLTRRVKVEPEQEVPPAEKPTTRLRGRRLTALVGRLVPVSQAPQPKRK
ncbi:MAG TPA: hypothetical protein VFK05_21145 [Polyangiaceae bacterium]|nr:hypothetical protein [Polyangiaceae bacterium]